MIDVTDFGQYIKCLCHAFFYCIFIFMFIYDFYCSISNPYLLIFSHSVYMNFIVDTLFCYIGKNHDDPMVFIWR